MIYLARRPEAVYVFHAFHKKTQATPRRDLEIAKGRFRQLLEETHEQIRELRKCLMMRYTRPTPEQAANPEPQGRTDAEDRSKAEETPLTQAEAASRCGVTQPRINDLLRGRVSRFSLDALVNFATALGCRVRVDLDAA